MGSAPDYEQAHRLNPDKFPKDPVKQLSEAQGMLAYVADILAAKTGKSRSDVLDAAKKAVSGGNVPQVAQPKAGSEQAEAKKVEKGRGKFFAHVERSSYYSMEALETETFKGVDESKLRFFESEEEAKANGFTAGVAPEEKVDEQKEEAKAAKKTAGKKK